MADYVVKSGDTLWSIATNNADKISGSSIRAKVNSLLGINNITDEGYLVVGQQINFSGSSSDSSGSSTATSSSRPTINVFGLQSNTDRTVYATWTWNKSNTEKYEVMWYYDTGDGVWFVGSNTTTEEKQSLYTAPSNAKKVKFKVKPVAETRTVNGTETEYWTASWSTEKMYDFKDNPPTVPDVPSVSIEKYVLTATLDNIDVNGENIQFQVVKDNDAVFSTGTVKITTDHATYSCIVTAGGEYKVRCRAYRDKKYSEWSDYSDNVKTIPSAPSRITTIRATSSTSVFLKWPEVKTATSYDIEYTTKRDYFDSSDQTTTINGIETVQYEKTGLESGEEYFFRVRAVNDQGHSAWSGINSIIVGKDPAAPTTWSSTTKVSTGEILTLYWIHNSEDNSHQTFAEVELYVDGVKSVVTIQNDDINADGEEEEETSSYSISTSEYSEGAQLQWRVRTAGITKNYGDWSIQRTVDVYAPPALTLIVTDVADQPLDTLIAFPFRVRGIAGPNTQTPVGYHLSVRSKSSYETVDYRGNTRMVNVGEQIYSKYLDISTDLDVSLSASDIDLENNMEYTIVCVVSMNSGLTATAQSDFIVSWTDEEYTPDLEIGVDMDSYSTILRPYCQDASGGLWEDAVLSVYRREFDGGFTELATNLENTESTFIIDPHPALDYARYRVVAVSRTTGAVSFYDAPGYPIGGVAAILQWNEEWSTFDNPNADELEEPTWSGSMLKLPYNVDVMDSHSADVSLVEYIGRSYPVSYYGTQLGARSTWNMEIPKNDEETLYALRRLAKWMGDVYVREPSGSGYWANVTVSFSQKHKEVTIPVTLDIVRVEGGV